MIWMLIVKYFKMKEHPNKKQINNVLDITHKTNIITFTVSWLSQK